MLCPLAIRQYSRFVAGMLDPVTGCPDSTAGVWEPFPFPADARIVALRLHLNVAVDAGPAVGASLAVRTDTGSNFVPGARDYLALGGFQTYSPNADLVRPLRPMEAPYVRLASSALGMSAQVAVCAELPMVPLHTSLFAFDAGGVATGPIFPLSKDYNIGLPALPGARMLRLTCPGNAAGYTFKATWSGTPGYRVWASGVPGIDNRVSMDLPASAEMLRTFTAQCNDAAGFVAEIWGDP